jgi:hypothetical protein
MLTPSFILTPDAIVVAGRDNTTLATISLRFSVGTSCYHRAEGRRLLHDQRH